MKRITLRGSDPRQDAKGGTMPAGKRVLVPHLNFVQGSIMLDKASAAPETTFKPRVSTQEKIKRGWSSETIAKKKGSTEGEKEGGEAAQRRREVSRRCKKTSSQGKEGRTCLIENRSAVG